MAEEIPRPSNPVLVLHNGTRVAVDLAYHGHDADYGHVWRVVIEGQIDGRVISQVSHFDAEMPSETSILVPTQVGQQDLTEFAKRIHERSPCFRRTVTIQNQVVINVDEREP
jgi:hypothetical protein